MRRVAIIGCGGSGKSTLAAALGRLLELPVYHLDQLYWKPGWVETPKPEWVALQQRLCEKPVWITDGNYGGTMDLRLAAADTVIFLDLPTWTCLSGAFRRFWKYRGSSRPDMSEGCPEQLTGEYLWWICTYRRKRRPSVLRKLERWTPEKRIVILKSRQATAEFLRDLSRL